jgi:membrane-bound lytic murein transglycosylase B
MTCPGERGRALQRQVTVLLLLMGAVLSAGAARADSFDDWLAGLRREAASAGVSQATLGAALAGVRPMPDVLDQDRNQPEFTMTFAQYLPKVVSPTRIADGRRMMQIHAALLKRVGDAYGVQPRFIVALWAVESDYGRVMGGYPIVGALATLAYGSSRPAMFRHELIDALRIVDAGDVTATGMTGSWAGAMGQCQFMPSSYLRYAVDFDGDGRRDIWTKEADVFASIANYLAKLRWRADQTWGREVRLPRDFSPRLIGLGSARTLGEWQRLGIRNPDGSALPRGDLKASLVAPDGPGGSVYLVYANFRTIMQWNRSTFFATSVGLLADQLVAG